jgi:hypothetical protein
MKTFVKVTKVQEAILFQTKKNWREARDAGNGQVMLQHAHRLQAIEDFIQAGQAWGQPEVEYQLGEDLSRRKGTAA